MMRTNSDGVCDGRFSHPCLLTVVVMRSYQMVAASLGAEAGSFASCRRFRSRKICRRLISSASPAETPTTQAAAFIGEIVVGVGDLHVDALAEDDPLERLGKGPVHDGDGAVADDGEILEVNQVCAYFNYSNRLLNGLGVDTEGDTVGYYT